MGTVVQHPAVIDAQQRNAATRVHDLASTVDGIVTALVEARCSNLPSEARDGIAAMVCVNVAARASGRASVAMGSDALDDWRCAATMGDAVIVDAFARACAHH